MVELNASASPGRAAQAEQALLVAQRICDERGLRLTELRAAVLQAIAWCAVPIGAYPLLSLLQQELGKKFAPPTVYRALDFLLELGSIARVESRNAYVLRNHPGRPGSSVLFLCDQCDSSVTIENPGLAKLIEGDAAALKFHLSKPLIECNGTCGRCAEAAAGVEAMVQGKPDGR